MRHTRKRFKTFIKWRRRVEKSWLASRKGGWWKRKRKTNLATWFHERVEKTKKKKKRNLCNLYTSYMYYYIKEPSSNSNSSWKKLSSSLVLLQEKYIIQLYKMTFLYFTAMQLPNLKKKFSRRYYTACQVFSRLCTRCIVFMYRVVYSTSTFISLRIEYKYSIYVKYGKYLDRSQPLTGIFHFHKPNPSHTCPTTY